MDEPLPLIRDGAALGLRRVVVATGVGPVVARIGERRGGPALLLVHGAAGSWTTWTPLLQHAARCGAPLTDVVAVDLPGWGESPPPRVPLDAASAAEALAVVLRATGHDRWTAVGHSLGGVVALELAVQEPAATERVVLVSPTGPAILDAARRPVRGGARLPWFTGMRLAMRGLGALPRDGRRILRLLAGALGPLSAPLFADRRRVDASVGAAFASEIRPAAFSSAVRTAATYDLHRWQRVRCPVRSVRGERDVFVGRRDAVTLAATIPDFAETVVHGAGHFAAIERPEAVLAVL